LLALLAGGAVLVAWWQGLFGRPAPGPLDGKLVVAVRPSGRGQQRFEVEEPGALPVKADGWMSLEVSLNQPAYVYLVWIDSTAQAVPLYPWNNDSVEVKDVNQPPPLRRAAREVISPMTIGSGWRFGPRGGLETVLLLARRTPLGEGTKLGSLLDPLPPTKLRRLDEVVILGLGGGAGTVSTLFAQERGSEEEARAIDEPLQALMVRLRDHFELIRAVRFAHEGE
jgi:hypothetical protein